MQTDEIVEGNNILAVFMGGRYADECVIQLNSNEIWLSHWGICRFDTVRIGVGKILEYHKSWDWLLPVIKKLGSMPCKRVPTLTASIFQNNIEVAWAICVENVKYNNRLQTSNDE